MVADQYPYDRAATNLGIRLPSWALADGKMKERLADPATRAKIAAEMKQNLVRDGRTRLCLRHRRALRFRAVVRRQEHPRDRQH